MKLLPRPENCEEEVRNLSIPGPGGDIPLRVYTPNGNENSPMLLYFHGGAYVAGNLDTHDNVCRYISTRVPCIIVSVDYRLAPEHKFPAAVEDCYAGLCWAIKSAEKLKADANRIAVAGDSAGGTLSAVMALLVRDRKGPMITFQLLVNPAVDMTDMVGYEWFRDQYLKDKIEWKNPYASPLYAESYDGLPQAFVITSEHDTLCKQGEEYVAKLRKAGVFANSYRLKGKDHLGPQYAGATDEVTEALELSVVVLRSVFRKRK